MSVPASNRPHAEPRLKVKADRSKAANAHLRSCAACRKKSSPTELTRWVLGDDGGVLPDLGRGAFGRGAWLHADRGCLKKGPAGLSRGFKAPVRTTSAELALLLASAAERRADALIGAARRARQLAAGKTAVAKELGAGRCRLVVVATDARTAARATEVQQAVAAGKAVGWGTRLTLGSLSGRGEAGVLGVLDDGLANALKTTIAMAHSARSAAAELASAPSAAGGGKSTPRVPVRTKSSTEVG